MKTIISIFFLLLISFSATTYPIDSAMAAGVTTQDIEVFHPYDSKTIAMGRETFTYKTFRSDIGQTISQIEITQPSEYEGLLLRKHILQSPETIYIQSGEFEFVFSQSDQKFEVKEGNIVSVPAGFPFGFRHISKGEGKVLAISHSDALPKMLSEVGTPVADAAIASKANKLDITKISSVAKKYGIEFLN